MSGKAVSIKKKYPQAYNICVGLVKNNNENEEKVIEYRYIKRGECIYEALASHMNRNYCFVTMDIIFPGDDELFVQEIDEEDRDSPCWCIFLHESSNEEVDFCENNSISTIEEFKNRFLSNINDKKGAIPLGHAIRCPPKELHDKNIDPHSTNPNLINIKSACCVLAERINPETNKKEILLTRRKSTMTFPNVWVIPGGHVDKGESLEEAAIRELKEECSIEVSQELLHSSSFAKLESDIEKEKSYHIEPICLWESAYPPRLEVGPLKRQHLIAYYVVHLEDKLDTSNLEFQEDEIGGAAWLNEDQIRYILSHFKQFFENGGFFDSDSSDYYPLSEEDKMINVMEWQEHEDNQPSTLVTKIYNIDTLCQKDVSLKKERISSATLFCLLSWLNVIDQDNNNNNNN
eukprot:TRINITY_DN687_c1_g1_i1.p1 TRINITY_DN687_c1_g1~~TRINITY_DN687_c1_g1_i1.p1  ORF type:complete len:404 (-),score=127.28 TRINITY_DN687_c1_g1_i1:48-1259(-)